MYLVIFLLPFFLLNITQGFNLWTKIAKESEIKGFQPWFTHLLAMWSSTSHLSFQDICKMELISSPLSDVSQMIKHLQKCFENYKAQ